jgi:ATP synthase protein I
MFRLVILQTFSAAIVALLAWLFWSPQAGISALLGGAAVVVPNGLFALRLTLSSRRPEGPGITVFFVGEFIKVASILALLALVIGTYEALVWPAMLIALVAAMKGYLLGLLFK